MAGRTSRAYRGRFAPTPSGALHAGSLAAALASWLDARAQGGTWLLRIEDVDRARCVAGADHEILRQLARCGLLPDEPPLWQSQRGDRYASALDRLVAAGRAYGCACSRADIARAWAETGRVHQRHSEWVYPGSCRPGRGGLAGRPARAWRLHTGEPGETGAAASTASIASTAVAGDPAAGAGRVRWHDRRLGPQCQDVPAEVGDFVLRRADGCWAYQLAVVVDDAEQHISHVVRGEDLADNTPRQILLQRALGLPTPVYLHTPLLRAADGEKLSKSHGAPPVDLADPAQALRRALRALDLPTEGVFHPGAGESLGETLRVGVSLWAQRWPRVA